MNWEACFCLHTFNIVSKTYSYRHSYNHMFVLLKDILVLQWELRYMYLWMVLGKTRLTLYNFDCG
jgi:hypothetical protein